MKRTLSLVAGVALVALSTPATAQVIFGEDWDDGNGSSRWSAPIVAQEDPGIAFDGSVDYAFDYSTIGAASAPNSTGGTTLGVAFETNTTDQCPADPNCTDSDEGEAMAIVPLAGLADIPSGDFVLSADMYLFWNFESGSTEYGTLGVHSGGTAAPLRFGLDNGDGLAWQVDSDGDSSTDILRFEGPAGSETGLGGYEAIPFGSIPNVNTGVPGVDFPGNQPLGPVNQWVEMKVASVGGQVSISMNGYVIDTFDNSGGSFSDGTVIIGGSDPFNSVNVDNSSGLSNLQVFDNVVLSVPEPTSLVLLGTVGIAMLGMRRRRT